MQEINFICKARSDDTLTCQSSTQFLYSMYVDKNGQFQNVLDPEKKNLRF